MELIAGTGTVLNSGYRNGGVSRLFNRDTSVVRFRNADRKCSACVSNAVPHVEMLAAARDKLVKNSLHTRAESDARVEIALTALIRPAPEIPVTLSVFEHQVAQLA